VIVIMLPSTEELLLLAALVLLGGLNIVVWVRVLRSRPTRPRTHHLRPACVLCKSHAHSMREHVTLPQAVLTQREEEYAASRTLEYTARRLVWV
jgi:hypothetical protein